MLGKGGVRASFFSLQKRGEFLKLPVSRRLLACAAMVPRGARVADVGCDHGYLGIYLLREGLAAQVAAMDLRREPLETARRNARRFGMEGRMTFTVCDGVSALGPGAVDAVVCAGMGGDTIAGILAACPWARDPAVAWILQPQSSGNDLRRWLGENGFAIRREALVREGGFLYTALEARWGTGRPLSPGEQYASRQLLENDPELVRAYLARVRQGIVRAVDGLARARDEGLRDRRAYYAAALREFTELEEAYANGTGD